MLVGSEEEDTIATHERHERFFILHATEEDQPHMQPPRKDIFVFVMNVPPGVVESVRRFEEESGETYRIMLLWDSRVRDTRGVTTTPGIDINLSCDFSKPEKIAAMLLPYQAALLAITCRSEQYLGRFAEVIPHVPYLRTPTPDSLRWASDKYEMRKRLKLFDPKITPDFTLVSENTKKERKRITEKIGFPMIIKPTNLAGSLFVATCYHEEELEQTLRTCFRKLRNAYKADDRLERPQVIAEQYMEGDMYSIDSYVGSRGGVIHCPIVSVVTGKKIGHDDFFNHVQMTPTGLKPSTVRNAEAVAEQAIHALGLRSVTTHTELMKLDDEWKVIEIGARMGGFRHLLHQLSCGIDHALNDIRNRIPKKFQLPKRCQGYACAIKWFAEKEGKITEMKGIKKIEQLASFHSIDMNKKIGDRAEYARNGGRSIFNLFLFNEDRSKLLADIRRVEKLVEVKVQPKGTRQKLKEVVGV